MTESSPSLLPRPLGAGKSAWTAGASVRAIAANGREFDGVAELARRHGRELRALARRLTRDHDDASDLLQDALERAMRSGRVLTTQALLGWTVTVMRNLFIDRCRQRQVARRGMHNLHLLAHPFTADAWEALRSETSPTSKDLACEQLATAVASLDVRFRIVFELYAGGLSLIQISSALGIPKATVGTRLYRARRKLQAALQTTAAVIQGEKDVGTPSAAAHDTHLSQSCRVAPEGYVASILQSAERPEENVGATLDVDRATRGHCRVSSLRNGL